MTLSVLTFNLWHDSPPFEARTAHIRRCLTELAPDLIGFQEALRRDRWCQVSDLLAGSGYFVRFGAVVPFWKRGGHWYGNAVASRWPISHAEVVRLPQANSRQRRGALSVRIAAPWGPIRFASTHLHHRSPRIRALQVAALLDHLDAIRKSEEYPPILVGDLNASPESAELRLATRRLRDAFAECGRGDGFTWSERNPYAKVAHPPGSRLDYVLVATPRGADAPGAPLRCRVVFDRERGGVWPSDHFGVYAELRAPPRADRLDAHFRKDEGA